ncbi:MAG: 50S ribosomal protein L24 [Patescibacteria group bacterium]
MKIKKGDKVKVIKGKDRNKEGEVARVFPKNDKVLINGLNLYKRHLQPRGEGQKGEIKELSRPFPASNVQLICPKCKLITRVGYQVDDGKKARICKKCQQII